MFFISVQIADCKVQIPQTQNVTFGLFAFWKQFFSFLFFSNQQEGLELLLSILAKLIQSKYGGLTLKTESAPFSHSFLIKSCLDSLIEVFRKKEDYCSVLVLIQLDWFSFQGIWSLILPQLLKAEDDFLGLFDYLFGKQASFESIKFVF